MESYWTAFRPIIMLDFVIGLKNLTCHAVIKFLLYSTSSIFYLKSQTKTFDRHPLFTPYQYCFPGPKN